MAEDLEKDVLVDKTEQDSNEQKENEDVLEEKDDLESDEEQVEETDEESEEEESQEADEEESDEEPKYYDSEEEYLKEQGIPESLKDIDSVMNSYKESIKENDRLRTALNQKPDAEQARQPEPETTDTQSYFNDSPFKEVLSQMDEQGLFKMNPDAKKSYEQFVTFADQAMSPFIKKLEATYTAVAQEVTNNRDAVQSLFWDNFKHPQKSAIKKEDVFKAMREHGFDSFDKAFSWVALQNPDLIKQISKKSEEKGLRKGQKKLKRYQGLRRSKEKSTSKHNYAKYQDRDGNWNNTKLDSLPDFGVSMLEAWEKENKGK